LLLAKDEKMKPILGLIIIMLALVSISAAASDECQDDTQCKGNRFCLNGRCVPQSQDSSTPDDTSPSNPLKKDLPTYCCTNAGRLGPYPNPDIADKSLYEGDACYGTTALGQILNGAACY
jgi:hypothetical protein